MPDLSIWNEGWGEKRVQWKPTGFLAPSSKSSTDAARRSDMVISHIKGKSQLQPQTVFSGALNMYAGIIQIRVAVLSGRGLYLQCLSLLEADCRNRSFSSYSHHPSVRQKFLLQL